jgi:hypothetical protein
LQQDLGEYTVLRKNMLTLSAFSAAVLLLLAAASSLIPLSNLLQPVQAQSSLSFRTTEPADGSDTCTRNTATLTFDAQGTPSSSHPQYVDITSGTFRITSNHDGQTLYSGNIIYGGRYVNTSGGGEFALNAQANDVTNNTSACISKGEDIRITTSCSTSDTNGINVYTPSQYEFANFQGAVDCSQRGGGDTTTQQSSSMTGTTTQQDRDGDGILDANDNCPNLPYTRCYKEGDTAVVVHNSNR